MTELRTKLYQMFILGLDGEGFKKALQTGLGGIIFFTDDIKSKEQFKDLILQIKKYSNIYPPFLSIDQEGGRVERTENIHGKKKYLSAKFAYEKGEEFLITQTNAIASELKDFGINLNFAPCIDVNTNPNNPIIGERSFSSNPDEVTKAAQIVSEIYSSYGIIPCVKHFPGHGDANADSHKTLPQINLTLEEMEKIHIKPFIFSIRQGIQMIMVAHLHCSCFDKENIPTSLSRNALTYLRKTLQYDGVIISDDMIMQGVSVFGDVEACITGIKAGINMFIYRNSTPRTMEIIEKVYQQVIIDKELQTQVENSYSKIIELKQKFLTL